MGIPARRPVSNPFQPTAQNDRPTNNQKKFLTSGCIPVKQMLKGRCASQSNPLMNVSIVVKIRPTPGFGLTGVPSPLGSSCSWPNLAPLKPVNSVARLFGRRRTLPSVENVFSKVPSRMRSILNRRSQS